MTAVAELQFRRKTMATKARKAAKPQKKLARSKKLGTVKPLATVSIPYSKIEVTYNQQ